MDALEQIIRCLHKRRALDTGRAVDEDDGHGCAPKQQRLDSICGPSRHHSKAGGADSNSRGVAQQQYPHVHDAQAQTCHHQPPQPTKALSSEWPVVSKHAVIRFSCWCCWCFVTLCRAARQQSANRHHSCATSHAHSGDVQHARCGPRTPTKQHCTSLSQAACECHILHTHSNDFPPPTASPVPSLPSHQIHVTPLKTPPSPSTPTRESTAREPHCNGTILLPSLHSP